jgi:hypothetical protein
MDKRQKKKEISDTKGVFEDKKKRKKKTRQCARFEKKETRLEYFKERIFYSKNEFAHLNEYFIFPSRMMLMMWSIEQTLEFEEHLLLLFH